MSEKESGRARAVVEEHAYKLLASAALLLIVVGTFVYWWIEDWSWVDSLYFSVVAVTTVGFGDLTPSSDGSKLFTVVYILSGITIITTYLNQRLKHKTKVRAARHHHSGDEDAAATDG